MIKYNEGEYIIYLFIKNKIKLSEITNKFNFNWLLPAKIIKINRLN